MEAYNDVDPGTTPIAYSLSELYPSTAQDTIWSEHSVLLNDFAGESVYITFHHTSLDKERIMLDEFSIISSTNILGCTDLNALNYNESATTDNGACIYANYDDYGCMDPDAYNYNSSATTDNQTCIYGTTSTYF